MDVIEIELVQLNNMTWKVHPSGLKVAIIEPISPEECPR